MSSTPATAPRLIAYLRVSTAKQGIHGLGVEAQREAVRSYAQGGAGEGAVILAEYVEAESGKRNDRPKLAAAIEHSKLAGARLVIAKLDRLSRDAAFLIGLRNSGVDFVAADMPQADSFTVGILALVAEREREMTSQRTKAALAAAKRRGIKLGNPNGAAHLRGRGNGEAVQTIKARADEKAERFRKTLAVLREEGVTSARGISRALNSMGLKTPRRGLWTATSVGRLLVRLESLKAS